VLKVCVLEPLLWPGLPDGGLGSDAAALILYALTGSLYAHCAGARVVRKCIVGNW
jgi:hypothetical protein